MKDCARQAFDEAAAAITGKRGSENPSRLFSGIFPAHQIFFYGKGIKLHRNTGHPVRRVAGDSRQPSGIT